MNIKKRLQHISIALNSARQYGKTTVMAKATKELGGILLCANFDDAKRIKHAHNVETKSYETNLDGINGPFFIDNYAISLLLESAVRKIDSLEKELEKLKNE